MNYTCVTCGGLVIDPAPHVCHLCDPAVPFNIKLAEDLRNAEAEVMAAALAWRDASSQAMSSDLYEHQQRDAAYAEAMKRLTKAVDELREVQARRSEFLGEKQ